MKGSPVLYGNKIHLTPFDRLSMHIVAQMRNLEDGMAGSYQFWPCSETEQDIWFDSYLKDQSQRRFIIHNDCAPVGWVGLTHLDYKDQGAELGIRIIPQYQRKGYGKEALHILSDWSFGEAHMHRLYSEVFSVNEPSRKLFEGAGWKEWGKKHQAHWQNGAWVDVLCFEKIFMEYVSIPSYWPQGTETEMGKLTFNANKGDCEWLIVQGLPTGILLDPVGSAEIVPIDTDVELLGLRNEYIPPQHQILDQVEN
jgi:RimJ/RimL family protein N-acetyltransferase